jgi:DNA-directed RNA polymerase sigma subunit (sigma70/sigma32)
MELYDQAKPTTTVKRLFRVESLGIVRLWRRVVACLVNTPSHLRLAAKIAMGYRGYGMPIPN